MTIKRILPVIAVIFLLQACEHRIEIFGQGDVAMDSNSSFCLYENRKSGPGCSVSVWDEDYTVTYYAVPRPGWQFARWGNYCPNDSVGECSFNVPALAVNEYAWEILFNQGGQPSAPPLLAYFEPLVPNPKPISDIVTVNGRDWAQVDLFSGLKQSDIDAACPTGICPPGSKLYNHEMSGWIWASQSEVNALLNSYLETSVPEHLLLSNTGNGVELVRDAITTWAPQFFADGWRATSNPGPYSMTVGYLAEPDLAAYLLDVGTNPEDAGADEAYSGQHPGNSHLTSRIGAWFYRDKDTDDDGFTDYVDPCPLRAGDEYGCPPPDIADIVIVGDKEWLQPDIIYARDLDEFTSACGNLVDCSGVLNQTDVTGWQLATLAEIADLFNAFLDEPYFSGEPAVYDPGVYTKFARSFFNIGGFRPTFESADLRQLSAMTGSYPALAHSYYARIEHRIGSSTPDYATTADEGLWGSPPNLWLWRPATLTLDTIVVDGKEWYQPDLFLNLSWSEIDSVCPNGACNGTLNGIDLTGWNWASIDDVNALFNYYIENPTPKLGPGPDNTETVEGAKWARYFFNAGWRPTYPVQANGGKWAEGLMRDSSASAGSGARIKFIVYGSGALASKAKTTMQPPFLEQIETMGAWFYR